MKLIARKAVCAVRQKQATNRLSRTKIVLGAIVLLLRVGEGSVVQVLMLSKAQVMALAARDSWLNQGANLLAFGPPGAGKSHLAAALGLALVENGWRVLFARTTDLVQKLQVARRDLQLEAAIARLDKYHLLILDDVAYVTKDQADTSVIFELIAARYERRSMFITANQPFGESGRMFPDQVHCLT
jgi:DNA replication protein DnaC